MSEPVTQENDANMKIEVVRVRACTDCCSTAAICDRFDEQDDGEGRVDTYCAHCGHSRDCHDLIEASAT